MKPNIDLKKNSDLKFGEKNCWTSILPDGHDWQGDHVLENDNEGQSGCQYVPVSLLDFVSENSKLFPNIR